MHVNVSEDNIKVCHLFPINVFSFVEETNGHVIIRSNFPSFQILSYFESV